MKVSRRWLERHVALGARTEEEVSHAFTMVGFEVEGVERLGLAAPLPGVVVGEVLTRAQHPNADRLSVCTVDVGGEGGPRQIVCGAQNYQVGDRVPVALPGAVLPGDFAIKVSKLRGVESQGMMCSARELGLGADHAGLLILEDRPAVGLPIHEVLPPADTVFDVEVTPNRPDCLSHLGLARELAAWFRLPLTYPPVPAETHPADDTGRSLLAGVTVEVEEACPLYHAAVVTGVKVGPSPAWLQELLRAVGQKPVNNVVDVTNFVMLETGQPLHAFDARKLRGGRIVVRKAGEGERLQMLDGRERALSGHHLVIADAERPLVVAGVMGGVDAEVDASTTDLILEAAFFRPRGIRRTARALGVSTDSSYRYERGVDAHGTWPAALRALGLLSEVAGGQWVGPTYPVGGAPRWETEIAVEPDFLRERLGFDLPDAEICEVLESLELEIPRMEEREDGRKVWTVAVPSWRGDLDRPIDLVEEVLRIHGTDKIPGGRVRVESVVAEDAPEAEFVRAASEYLAARGFVEAVNLTLRAGAELASWVSPLHAAELRLANPLAEEQSLLRHSLVIGLLETLRFNQARQTGAVRFFETGRTFRDVNGAVYEMVSAAFVLRHDPAAPAWKRREAPDFHWTKRLVEDLARKAGVEVDGGAFRPVDAGNSSWQEGHSAAAGGADAGYEVRCGLMNPAMTEAQGITGDVYAGTIEILPEKLRELARRARGKPVAVPAHPAAVRDVAVVAPAGQSAAAVRDVVASAAGASVEGARFAVESVVLFDLYEGPGVAKGHRSLAYTIAYRAADRTLTEEEVNAAFGRLQAEVERRGLVVRK